ncbi:MAG: hypothetical protein Q9218_001839 [Villophora microphyllina]
MSNTRGTKRRWNSDEEHGDHKRGKYATLQHLEGNEGKPLIPSTNTYKTEGDELISHTGQVSEESDDAKLVKLEAEVARIKYEKALRRNRQRTEQGQIPRTRPLSSNDYPLPPSRIDTGGTQPNAYTTSQDPFGDDAFYGSRCLEYGATEAGSSTQRVHSSYNAPSTDDRSGYTDQRRVPMKPSTFSPPPPVQAAYPQGHPFFGAYYDAPSESPRNHSLITQPSTSGQLPQARPIFCELPQIDGSYGWDPAGSFTDTTSQLHFFDRPTQAPATQQPNKRGRDDGNDPSEEAAPKTKRQKKLETYAKQGKELGADNKEKGQVRFDENGNMESKVDGEWVPAVYHHDRRERLLNLADRNGRLQYRYPPTQGLDPNDRTAYHPDYRNIDMKERIRRDPILYLWDPPKDRPKGERDPGYMRDPDDAQILLIDRNNHPIKNYKELPTVISGQVSGL